MTTTSTDRRNGVNIGAAVKVPCNAATTANITLSGEQTIDGVSLVDGDRILVKSQTDGIENGIYEVSTSAWQRTKDWDGQNEVKKGTLVFVHSGTTNQGWWYVSTSDPITVGTTSVTIAQASSILAVFSAFIQTLLNDASAAEARTTLGAAAEADAVMDTDAAGGDLTGNYPNPTIAALAVTAAKLAADAVTTTKILDANVTEVKLADDAVSGAKLKATIGTFVSSSLASGATQSTDIAVAYASTCFVLMRGTGSVDQNFDLYFISPANNSQHILGQGSTGSAAAFAVPAAGNVRLGVKNNSGSAQVIIMNYLILSE